MVWQTQMLEAANPVSLPNLKTMDLLRFQELVLTAFKQLGYSIWLSESLNEKIGLGILLKDNGEERSLVRCGLENDFIDISLLRDFCQTLSKEGIASGFFVTTGMVRLLERTYFSDQPIDFIDAKKLPLFLKTVFGELGLKREINQISERRRFPRLTFSSFKENKMLRWLDTFYGAAFKANIEATDISSGGIGLATDDKIPSLSLLRFEFSLPDTQEAIKAIGKVVWQGAKSGSLGYNLGLSFFLLRDRDKEQISNFVKSRLSLESKDLASDSPEAATSDSLLRLLVEKNIIGHAVYSLNRQGDRGIRGLDKVDIEKVEASVRRFFKKMFSKKCKVLEIRKIPNGWETLAKKIDDWFEKKGYREVYEKKIYAIQLDDKFKVLSYSQISSDYVSKSSALVASPSIDTDKIREIVKEVVKEVSAESKDNNIEKITEETLKKIALETADEIERRRKDQESQKKETEGIKIKESYISPLEEMKLERNFVRIGKIKRIKRGIKSQVESLQGLKKSKTQGEQ